MTHDPGCPCDAYACRLRAKGVSVSPKATPSQRNTIPPRQSEGDPFARPIVYQDRPGGFKMPIFTAKGDHLRIKQYREQRHKIDAQLARIQAGKGVN